MNPEQLQAIRARLDAATPHPWSIRRWKGDDELITNAPTDLRALLAEVERLTTREESLVKQSVAQIGLIGRLQEKVEWQRAVIQPLSESQERLAAELKQMRAEVERLTHNLVQTERHAQIIENSNKLLEAKVNAVGELLSENGCDCDCECVGYSAPHGPDCEPCLACRIDSTIGSK